MTTYFTKDCLDVDAAVSRLCAIHQNPHKLIDTPMRNSNQNVRFDQNIKVHEITPYAELYDTHPRFLLPTGRGFFKSLPPRCDPFTGKSLAVMKERRKALRKKFSSGNAKRVRRATLLAANASMVQVQNMGHAHMDLDMYKTTPTTTSTDMDVDTSMSTDVNMGKFAEPLTQRHGSICANRTKPVNSNKYQKRLGAKKAKKLELDQNAEFTLSQADATTYRALAARCNYLSQDRPDISFASKELCREFSIPNMSSFKKLKRLVRYLCGLPRLVYHFKFQQEPQAIEVFVDTDFAGCQSTRRSTSGGVAMVGQCCVKHWSKTQSTISLSSGEAELHGIAMGCSQALGLQSLLNDLGWNLKIKVRSDATAAIGIARRKGMGKIRHLDTTDLWIQDVIRSGKIDLSKVPGPENPADILTKYVERKAIESALPRMSLVPTDGRPASAPIAMGA